jgi:hypothetical protein
MKYPDFISCVPLPALKVPSCQGTTRGGWAEGMSTIEDTPLPAMLEAGDGRSDQHWALVLGIEAADGSELKRSHRAPSMTFTRKISSFSFTHPSFLSSSTFCQAYCLLDPEPPQWGHPGSPGIAVLVTPQWFSKAHLGRLYASPKIFSSHPTHLQLQPSCGGFYVGLQWS